MNVLPFPFIDYGTNSIFVLCYAVVLFSFGIMMLVIGNGRERDRATSVGAWCVTDGVLAGFLGLWAIVPSLLLMACLAAWYIHRGIKAS